ncbi:MAG TPA: type 4a pilus biogenesis protein PilO [Solirubrobacteraceae bacterium]
MTSRDRIVLMVVVGVAAIAGFWFLVLGPKREEATKLDAKVAAAQQRLVQAQSSLGQAQKAKREYQTDYATVAQLGKAVPKDDNMPSLLYQLQSAAGDARIDFRSVQISGASPDAPAASAAGGAASSGASDGASSGSSSGASSGASGGASGTSGSSTPAAGQAATSALPPGASVGSAGFPTIPMQFTFRGSYFDMEHLLREVQRFVTLHGNKVRVRGRLLTIDGVALVPQSFPEVRASISATAYLLPSDDTSSAGATAQAPATASSGSEPASPAAPKVPAPAATAMGVAR